MADSVMISQRKDGLRRIIVFLKPRYLTLVKPHNCLTTRKACYFLPMK
jgi:hypothetical protein